MTDITIRQVTDDEYPAFVTAFMEGFSEDLPSESFVETERVLLPPERTLAAFDGDTIVGTFGGFDLSVTVPGGASMPMEGTTVVTVFPTHRRMGLLRQMMVMHLDNAAEAGYPIAGLWASETDIYGRFGYGIATYLYSLKMSSPKIVFRDDVTIDRVRRITQEQAAIDFPGAYAAMRRTTPGMLARSADWWKHYVLADEEWMRKGKTKRRYIVHDGPDGVDGYATYRSKGGESDDLHDNGTVHVVEVIAATPRAEASLWAYLTRVDGAPNVESWNNPVNGTLRHMVKEPRRVRVSAVSDALWIRILDVEAALTGRTYEEDGSVSITIADAFRPETAGSYRIEVEDGSATVERCDEGDIAMDIEVLGAVFLGGADALAYARAGRIVGSVEDVTTFHRLFRTANAPWIDTVF
jgi:predicted acetyltransferase